MAKNITARDLMKLSFLRLGSEHSLREALGILLDTEAGVGGQRVLIVLGADGSFAGTLTTRSLLHALLPLWVDEQLATTDEVQFERRLLSAMEGKLDLKVGQAMQRDVPTVGFDDRLPHLIEIMQDKRLDCVPVLDGERVVGVVFLTDVFNAAAALALATQTDTASPR